MENLNIDANLHKFVNSLPKSIKFTILKNDKNSVYSAYSVQLNNYIVEFRTSNITPKKLGQFVAIWKRDKNNITQPFDITDEIDFIIIYASSNEKNGYFIFPSSILIQKNIISKNFKGGKRGIRIYPSWEKNLNKLARKTQEWQEKYFIEDLELIKNYIF